ncbi:helicase-associated domain-containing protein [Paenibacillus sp. VCA1]|uniref:helicase-associated domain-containing protein n=1 Tax=Paenibacillus sp. VCA1 TaxID=3039148 RepID=UPI002871D763|nr:helicase-associated domain-containing protein [Paenibacillus sp. VCA1]MDR9852807.1 helicase-associated domain-containing protein [Paenibacillus sp. VCA1]
MSVDQSAGFEESFGKLAGCELELLKGLVGRFAGQPFGEQAWEGIGGIARTGAELKLSFLRLRKYGWVHAVKKAWGERLYYIPTEKLVRLLPVLYVPEHNGAAEAGLVFRQEAGPGLPLDLLHALAFVADQGLPLTAKGTVHKKSLQKLMEPVFLSDEHVKRLALQYAHQDAWEPAPAVLLDLLLCTGLLSPGNGAFVLEGERLRSWLSLTEREMNRILLRTVIERYGPNDAGLQLFRYFICFLPDAGEQWIDVSSLLRWMEGEGMLRAAAASEQAEAWLCALAGFGWGDVAETAEGGCAFRWNVDAARLLLEDGPEAEASASGFFVQPDFDVLCPPDVPFLLRWKLLAFAELVQCDRVSVYKLTRAGIAKAAEKGIGAAEIVQVLSAGAAAEIPGHVAAAIEQWGRELGRTRFEEALLLSCLTENEADRIAAARSRIEGALERIGPKHFIAKTSDTAKIRKILETMGLAPLKTVGTGERAHPSYPLIGEEPDGKTRGTMPCESFHERQGVVYGGRNVRLFDPDPDIPEPASLFPGYEGIPARWLRDYRSYHSSTAQTIVEQAQSWQTRILLNLEGRQAEFAPTAVHSGPWRAEGVLHDLETGAYERRELTAGELRELKLIVPEFD